nr:unnamed protein product [Callosobruchus analis]
MLMQRLWAEKISWDQPVSNSIASRWNKFKNELTYLNDSCIPRRVICKDAKSIELHGFSDASELAYGACLYVRTVNSLGQVSVKLLCAKSKVSPLKKLTIPRLELCGALLLARLFSKVIKSIGITFDKVFLRSDSMVVLAWINTSSHLLKTFVSNGVVEIQSLSAPRDWHHVPTDSNPADLIYRGLHPSQIGQSSLWWNGPEYLMLDPQDWPSSYQEIKVLSELKTQEMALVSSLLTPSVTTHFPWDRFSSFSKLKRTMAFMLRFIGNYSKAKCDRVTGPLTASQLSQAVERLVRVSQRESFAVEYKDLLESKPLSSSSNLLKLNPFMENNIIRVGGRLINSDYPYKKKHPMIIHCKHSFTKMLFAYEHLRLFHAGPQLLISSLRNQFWPVAARNLARSTVRNCMRCFRFNAEAVQPIMGDLLRDRITPTSPFLNTGVDYAGPFTIRIRKGRGSKTEKCYVAVFICFSTKAIHLELVSSLSSDAFLNCLRRFIARRGKPNKIFSDNGTNFVGAKRELTRFLNCNTIQFQRFCADDGIMWYFIPPQSPHFGGLWEAGVKGFKHHLKRVLGDASLTFEEFTTLIIQIEAILNSRPLCPLSSDPNDLTPLSPAHFLIGRSLVATPDEELTDVKMSRLTRYQLVQRICQHFWNRWQNEYLGELQQRKRWTTNKGCLEKGALVLLKEKHTPPTQWKLGRIIELHKGAYGVARVATIKIRTGAVKCGFQKICPLPVAV